MITVGLGATHSTVKAALAGLDEEMAGDTYFGAALKKAVEAGEVLMARLDDMVRHILHAEFASVAMRMGRSSFEVPCPAKLLALKQRPHVAR